RPFLMLLGGMGFLVEFIFILAKVHDLADRRLRHGRHFDKIVSHLLRFLERINRRHDAELLALRTDDAYWRDSDLSIDSQFWNGDRAPLSCSFIPWARCWSARAPPLPFVNGKGSPLLLSRLRCPLLASIRTQCRLV